MFLEAEVGRTIRARMHGKRGGAEEGGGQALFSSAEYGRGGIESVTSGRTLEVRDFLSHALWA